MKRWLTLTLAGLLALSLAGCGSSDGAGSSAPQKINSSSSGIILCPNHEDSWGLILSVKNVIPHRPDFSYHPGRRQPHRHPAVWQRLHSGGGTGRRVAERPRHRGWKLCLGWYGLSGHHGRRNGTGRGLGLALRSPLPRPLPLKQRVYGFPDTGDYDTQLYEVEFDIP